MEPEGSIVYTAEGGDKSGLDYFREARRGKPVPAWLEARERTEKRTTMGEVKRGDRVYVDDAALADLRRIMREATGEDPPPNHHGTVEDVTEGQVLIVFDDGQGAPYPPEQVHRLEDNDG